MKHIAEFKADMHCLYIKACKDLAQAWTSLRFITIDDVIDGIMDTWSPAWREPAVVERNKAAIR